MRINVDSYQTKDTDARTIATLRMNAVPRIGEHLTISGPQFRSFHDQKEDTRYFRVTDVIWEATIDEDGKGSGDIIEATVIVELDEQMIRNVPELVLACVCKTPMVDTDRPGICDNCSDRLPGA